MGDLEIHGAYGWRKLEDIIIGEETCSLCQSVGEAEGAGYVKCNPPELMVWLCRKCR
jgi:hypothetical protein